MSKKYGVIAIDTITSQVDTIDLFDMYYNAIQCMIKTASSEQEQTINSEDVIDNELSFKDGELLYKIIEF